MEKKYNFVKTTDEETAKRLRDAGFIELDKEGNRFVFINEIGKLDFSNDDINVTFDNKLMI